jgi:signal peptidase I
MSKVDKIAEVIAEVVQKLPQLTAFEAFGLIDQRVFTRGIGTKGEVLQYKSDYYKKKRRDMSRQTNYVDFELTSKLRKSLGVGVDSKGDIVFGVDGTSNDNISNAELLEIINKKFDNFITISEDEKTKILETAQRFFKDNVIKGINEIR